MLSVRSQAHETTYCDSVCMPRSEYTNPGTGEYINGSQGLGREELGRGLLMGMGFHWGSMKMFWSLIMVMVAQPC